MSAAVIVVLLVRYGMVLLFLPFSALDKVLNFHGAVAQAAEVEPDPLPIVPKLTPQRPTPVKALSLGAEPGTASGESCRILDVLKASEAAQEDEFKAVVETASELRQTNLRLSVETLVELQSAFGDDERGTDL